MPGFVKMADKFKKEKGVDIVACVAVNDSYVMDAWATDQKIGDNIVMLADGSANLANGNLVSVSLWIAFGLKGKKSRNQN